MVGKQETRIGGYRLKMSVVKELVLVSLGGSGQLPFGPLCLGEQFRGQEKATELALSLGAVKLDVWVICVWEIV